jgi:hypothetical protein
MQRRHAFLLLILVAVAVLAGCGKHGGMTSAGAFEVAITDERRQGLAGNLCAIRGNATNVGNVRARVDLTYEARNAAGAVIGMATASFEVAPFSNLDFTSNPFSNNLACSSVADFARTGTDIRDA